MVFRLFSYLPHKIDSQIDTLDVFSSGNDLDWKPVRETPDLLKSMTFGSTLTLSFSQSLLHRKPISLLKIYLFVQFFPHNMEK